VLSFSHAFLSASPISMVAQPILDRLGSTLLQSCALAVLDGDDIVYLARSAGLPIISPILNVGRSQPAFCTSIGHVLLASLPKDELDAYFKRVRFYPFTPHTINSRSALRAAVDAARDADYAYASQQTELRLCSLAVPVRDASGACVAGLNVILKDRLLTREQMVERYRRPIQQAASELGAVLVP
jgi:IclR family pca regulon transcriptional regulator